MNFWDVLYGIGKFVGGAILMFCVFVTLAVLSIKLDQKVAQVEGRHGESVSRASNADFKEGFDEFRKEYRQNMDHLNRRLDHLEGRASPTTELQVDSEGAVVLNPAPCLGQTR